jgi:hypothetical protein
VKKKGYPQMTQIRFSDADEGDKKQGFLLVQKTSLLIPAYLRHLLITLFLIFAPTGPKPLAVS